MRDNSQVWQRLTDLFAGQKLAVVSTNQPDGHPYASLVAFVASEDLKCMYFATSRATRKYANLQKDGRTAMLVNNSRNQSSDFYQAMAATGIGHSVELSDDAAQAARQRYIERHPYLEDFVKSPSCAFFQVTLKTYYLVENFQNVTEVHL
ncbi:MAG: pyridoxamine 5'-phosphate oxidase family protein [Desulfobacterales bacterium]|nr:pyridoxamine 5'-phosphate oxidase family protein [Desulfobacterales bacterium]